MIGQEIDARASCSRKAAYAVVIRGTIEEIASLKQEIQSRPIIWVHELVSDRNIRLVPD